MSKPEPSVPLRLTVSEWRSVFKWIDDVDDDSGPFRQLLSRAERESINSLNRQFRDWQEQNRKETPCKTSAHIR